MKINDFLLCNGLLIKDNPAISPDMTLDFEQLFRGIQEELGNGEPVSDRVSAEKAAQRLTRLTLWPKSVFYIGKIPFFLIESRATGDCALISPGGTDFGFENARTLENGAGVIPLLWQNLIRLKNLVLQSDPSSTIFPRADGTLKKTSLGIGARFTALHWPAVAWVMKELGLPLTANQNSIPRELVYDVDAMLEGRLASVPFPFIGASVPEGHQGQSVQGMSHASIITFLKHGFHHAGIPWGFNADHQPVGGRFDAIEEQLALGSLFASYITYDVSPELSVQAQGGGGSRSGAAEPEFHAAVIKRLSSIKLAFSEPEIRKAVDYIFPAMLKVKRRDQWYVDVRNKNFTTEAGRRFFRELSIDELPGETAPQMLAVCLACVEAMGMRFDYVAPNIGFQKNIPFADNDGLKKKITSLYAVAREFGASLGFHSGSGKSAENYGTIGQTTSGRFEIKTSGRYTYEMGAALSQSNDPGDQRLWKEWYDFTRKLAVTGSFSSNEAQRAFAREFINRSLDASGVHAPDAFGSREKLNELLDGLKPSPDHAFWFEYNFLFVLAGEGSRERLGDHSVAGYSQRRRFYRISNQARLLFAKNVAQYILFLAESTGMAGAQAVNSAREKLAAYRSHEEMLDAIG